MTVYFTADLHFGHKNILKHSSRPYESIEAMEDDYIKTWNETVGPGDLIYCLGDFALCKSDHAIEIVKQLEGNKYLVFGNHDKILRKNAEFLKHWIWAKDIAEIEVEEQRIFLSHYAMRVWNRSHYGAWNLHGHSHGSLRAEDHLLQADVGVDCWEGQPVSFETLRDLMSTKTWEPVDHHGQEY